MRQCKHGRHGEKRTWCRHREVTKGAASVIVNNTRCDACPLYEASTSVRVQACYPEPVDTSCQHRGPVVRSQTVMGGCCPYDLPVLSCAVHGECIQGERRNVGIHKCEGCTDRLPAVKKAVGNGLPSVAVAIPCHNYGRFLGEAIESAKNQLHQPCDILVVDDSSTDNTREVAEAAGVRYLRIEDGDVFAARRTGYEATDSDLLCFLDADDILPPAYLETAAKMLAADWRLGIVHSDLERFGAASGVTDFPAGTDRMSLHRQNYIHAGAVVRRSALRICDAFAGPVPYGSHEDYYLWKVLIDYGWQTAKSPVPYRYRKHEGSMSDERRKRSVYVCNGACADRVSIVVPLAGRFEAWPVLRDWLEQQTWPRNQCSLVLGDTSQDVEFGQMVRDWMATCDYADIRYVAFPVGPRGLADEPRDKRPYLVQDAVLRVWSKLTKGLTTPWTLTVEDDTIPPPNVIERLLRSAKPDTDAVVAPYIARNRETWVIFRNGRSPNVRQPGTGVEKIDGAGFGCMLARSPLLENHVWTHGANQGEWYDPFWAKANRVNLLCDWTIPVRHLAAELLPHSSMS